jgi:hypothetical protein
MSTKTTEPQRITHTLLTTRKAAAMLDQGRRPEIGSRKTIDIAIGVLVALRGCTPDQAFDDLARAVHDTGIGLGTLAAALVRWAGGTTEPFPHREVVTSRWGTSVSAA